MGAYFLPSGAESAANNTGSGGIGMLLGIMRRQKVTGEFPTEVGVPGSEPGILLHTGNPGSEGVSNVATENTKKKISLLSTSLTKANYAAGRKNTANITWTEVKAAETYRWVSLWESTEVGAFMILAIELTAPVVVAVGDTFIINKEKLAIALKTS